MSVAAPGEQPPPSSAMHTSTPRRVTSRGSFYSSKIEVLQEVDFLGQQLGSLLSREPESPSQSNDTRPRPSTTTSTSHHHSSIHNKPTTSKSYTSPSEGSFVTIRRRSSTKSSNGKAGEGSTSTVMPTPSNRGVFGSFFSPPITTPGSGSPQNPARKIDYFAQNSGTSDTPSTSTGVALLPPSTTSMSTSFGRKPSQSRKKESCAGSSASQDRLIPVSESATISSTGSSSNLGKSSSHTNADSDPTTTATTATATATTTSSNETGITTPTSMTSKSEGSPHSDVDIELQTWTEESKEGSPHTILEPTGEAHQIRQEACDEEKSNDQTTWKRFKEGGVIEPPEAVEDDLHFHNWNGTTKGPKSSASRYTSLSSSRHHSGSPGGDTIKGVTANAKRIVSGTVSLIPLGDDGRTFRFVDHQVDFTPSLRRGSNGTSDDSGACPDTPKDIQDSVLQRLYDEPWAVAPPTKESHV